MNKLIKQLLENLFDDYDDIIQNDSDDIRTELVDKMLKYDAEKAKKWILNNISIIGDEDEIIGDINRYVTITVDDDNYDLNLNVIYYKIKFERPIPYYVRINKIKCDGGVIFSSSDNLPKEVGEHMTIESDEIKFTGHFPQKIKYLYIINCPKLKSLEGLNNSYTSIEYLTIKDCKNLQDLAGLPDSVGNLSLENCNFTNLKGCSKQLNVLNIRSCDKLENLIGCPESVDYIYLSNLDNFRSLEGCPSQLNKLNIRDCGKLKSLKHISPLITGELAFFYTGLIDLSNGPKEIQGNYEFMFNPNLIRLNAQDTIMTGHNTIFHCYGNDSLKELTGLPKMKYKDIKISTERWY